MYVIDGSLVQGNGRGMRSALIGNGRFITRTNALILRTIEIGIIFGLPFLLDGYLTTLYQQHQHYFVSYLIVIGLATYLIPIRRQLRLRRFSRNEGIGISIAGSIALLFAFL